MKVDKIMVNKLMMLGSWVMVSAHDKEEMEVEKVELNGFRLL